MRLKTSSICAAIVTSTWAFGCDRMEGGGEGEVASEIQDVQEARSQTAGEVRRLEDELAQAKQRVVDLEKKLALARQGITDDVLEERKELGKALQDEREEVRGEVSEAQREAQQYNQQTGKAEQVLEQTTPPKDVRAGVESHSEVTPGQPQEVERTQQEEEIVIDRVRGVDREEKRRTQTAEPAEQEAAPMEPVEPAPVVPDQPTAPRE